MLGLRRIAKATTGTDQACVLLYAAVILNNVTVKTSCETAKMKPLENGNTVMFVVKLTMNPSGLVRLLRKRLAAEDILIRQDAMP